MTESDLMRRVVVVTTEDIWDSHYFMEDRLDGCLSSTIMGFQYLHWSNNSNCISTPEEFHTISIYSTELAVAINKIKLPPHIGIDSMAACQAQSWGFNTSIGQILASTSQHLRDFILFPFIQQNLLLQ
jgi:hypothetical protein